MANRAILPQGGCRAIETLESPDWLLHEINFYWKVCVFVRVSARTYREIGFPDQRLVGATGQSRVVGFHELARLTSIVAPRQLAPRFLAHTSFCCSTLLARTIAFDERTLVLREPQVLLMLAKAFREHPASFDDRSRGAYLKLVLRLLNKAYHAGQHVILKPSNLVNRLLDSWLRLVPGTRGVLLTSTLEDYLVSVLKKPGTTREKLAAVADALLRDAGNPVNASRLTGFRSDFLKSAAVAWHAQQCHLGELIQHHTGRVTLLDAGDLLARPVAVVAAVCRHLKLPVSGEEIRSRVEGATWHRHAKDPSARFDPGVRAAQFRQVRRRHRDRIQATRDWLRSCLGANPAPPVLPAAAVRAAGAAYESARAHAPGPAKGG